MKLYGGNKGFTLIELVMVIVILGILASVAVPKFQNLSSDAKEAAEAGVVGGVRSGISIFAMKKQLDSLWQATGTNFQNGQWPDGWPMVLDGAATATASPTNALFDSVLAQGGVTDPSWSKTGAGAYTGPTGADYVYTAATGEFRRQ